MSLATLDAPWHTDLDLFSDAALDDPYPLCRRLRDAGPAAYLERHDLWFLGRYDAVRAALGDWQTWSSAHGIGLNPVINQAWASGQAVFRALTARVRRLEFAGTPTRGLNNITRGWACVPLRATA